MNDIIPVDGYGNSLVKNKKNNAVLSTDETAFINYKKAKAEKQKLLRQVSTLEEQVQSLTSKLDEVIKLLGK